LPTSDNPGLLGLLEYRESPLGLKATRPDAAVDRWAEAHIRWRRYGAIVARYVTSLVKITIPAGLPVIVDADDAVRRFAPPLPGLPAHRIARIKALARHAQFARALREVEHAFFCSDLDREAFPSIRSSVLPNVPFAPITPFQVQSSEKRVLFVGSLWYGPNREGVSWFVRRVWPKVRAAHPDATLRLIGAASEAVRQGWMRTPGVEAPGFVHDLEEEYRRAAYTIAPIWHGGGTSIKIVESYAHGRVAVVTTFAHGVIKSAFEAGDSVLVADSEGAMTAHCLTLLRDRDLARGLAQRGAAIVQDSFSRSRFQRVVREAVEGLLGRQK
jgi:glycosyltransferase involved in cell wall biosynthesis